jgi:hypothetical protein
MDQRNDRHPHTAASSRAALPAERAFVVQLRADADLARGVISGRVEHVVSGAAALFESMEQLITCMRDALQKHPQSSRCSDTESTP